MSNDDKTSSSNNINLNCIVNENVKFGIKVQKILHLLDSDNFTSTLEEIQSYFHSPLYINIIAQNISLFAQIRPKKVQTFVELSCSLCLQNEAFRKEIFQTSQGTFLRKLFKKGIFAKEEIYEKITRYENQYYYFAKEVGKIRDVKKKKSKNLPTMEKFYNKYRSDDWAEFEQLAENGFLEDSLELIIKNDDLDALKKKMSKESFDPNKKMSDNIFCPVGEVRSRYFEPRERCSLLSFAGFFGSSECFTHLLSSGVKFDDEVYMYSIEGGNAKIKNICKDHGGTFENASRGAVTYHRNDEFDWLLENGFHTNVPFNDIVRSGNLLVTSIYIHMRATAFDNDQFPLHTAASNGNYCMCELLLDNNIVDINKLENKSETALFKAVFMGHYECVKLFVDRGTDINHKNTSGWTALHTTTKNNVLEIATYLLDHGADINCKTLNDHTTLHYSIFNQREELAIELVNRGIELESNAEKPILFLALSNNFKKLSTLLIEKGVDINKSIEDHNGPKYPFDVAIEKRNKELIKLFKEKDAKRLKVIPHELQDPDPVQHVTLDDGYSVTEADEYGRTLLMRCCITGQTDLVQRLIQEGANIEVQDYMNNTPLLEALSKNHADIAKILIDNGANLNLKNKDGWAPLHYAVKNDMVDIVKIMIEKEVNLNCNYKGTKKKVDVLTPLSYCVSDEMRELLKSNGAV